MWIKYEVNNEYLFDLYLTNDSDEPVKQKLNHSFCVKSNLPDWVVVSAIYKMELEQSYISIKREFNNILISADEEVFFTTGAEIPQDMGENALVPHDVLIYGGSANYLYFQDHLTPEQKQNLAQEFLKDLKQEIIELGMYTHFKYVIQKDRSNIKSLHQLIQFNSHHNSIKKNKGIELPMQDESSSKKTNTSNYRKLFTRFKAFVKHGKSLK